VNMTVDFPLSAFAIVSSFSVSLSPVMFHVIFQMFVICICVCGIVLC
jgi:hypothetical protein